METTRELLIRFRTELQATQAQAAAAAGISLRSWSRYEGGAYEPGPKDFRKLSNLAREKGLPFLHSIFEGRLNSEIVAEAEANQKKLRSPGSARTIPYDRLTDWERDADETRGQWVSVTRIVRLIQDQIASDADPSAIKTKIESLASIAGTNVGICEALRDKIGLYTDTPAKPMRKREAAMLLRKGKKNLQQFKDYKREP